VLFFGIPAASFDLASFSFHVPICASLAKHTAPARKHSTRVNTLVFALISPPFANKLRKWFTARILVLPGEFCNRSGEFGDATMATSVDDVTRPLYTT
jgi:hypothetical protein